VLCAGVFHKIEKSGDANVSHEISFPASGRKRTKWVQGHNCHNGNSDFPYDPAFREKEGWPCWYMCLTWDSCDAPVMGTIRPSPSSSIRPYPSRLLLFMVQDLEIRLWPSIRPGAGYVWSTRSRLNREQRLVTIRLDLISPLVWPEPEDIFGKERIKKEVWL
jgi:hypothetical protein